MSGGPLSLTHGARAHSKRVYDMAGRSLLAARRGVRALTSARAGVLPKVKVALNGKELPIHSFADYWCEPRQRPDAPDLRRARVSSDLYILEESKAPKLYQKVSERWEVAIRCAARDQFALRSPRRRAQHLKRPAATSATDSSSRCVFVRMDNVSTPHRCRLSTAFARQRAALTCRCDK